MKQLQTGEIAFILNQERETSLNPFIMQGQLQEKLGFDGYCEAQRRRWVVADSEGSGFMTISRDGTIVHEMKGLAEEWSKADSKFCEKCKKKCSCCECPKPKAEESIGAKTALSFTTRRTFEDEVYGVGQVGNSLPTPGVPTPPATNAPATSAPSGIKQGPMGVGDPVTVVQDGQTLTGRIKAVGVDGKYKIDFAGQRPAVDRDYDATEVRPGLTPQAQ